MKYDDMPPPPPEREWQFVGELASAPPRRFFGRAVSPGGRPVFTGTGFRVTNNFPDPAGLLQSAVDDLQRLLDENDLGSGNYPIVLQKEDTGGFESYCIKIAEENCMLCAGDTEGMRRAVYEFEDLLERSCGTFLPVGKIRRSPWLKTRISRCFYSPTKRGMNSNDELADDKDYYPAEYLNRLARDGINGLYLVVTFAELAVTSFTAAVPDHVKRIEKLRKTVAKCARYGIKIYIFAIEPFAREEGDPLVKAHPEMFGAKCGNRVCFCPSSGKTRRYLEECTSYIFREVPGLGGLITITHGERPTTCLSAVEAISDTVVPCPRCANIPKGEIIRQSLAALRRGMDTSAPEALFFSWFYMPWTPDAAQWAEEIGQWVPTGVVAQFNFESGGKQIQSGREHAGGDYWLSYAGPSARFIRQCRIARKNGCEVSAKLQMTCGYELGTVPSIPVPGQLYRKFKAMCGLGVSHTMLCWYLGNYPSVMSRAAGTLAFETFDGGERTFLQRLAGPGWGTSAEKAADAWMHFRRAYAKLPFSLISQYYGPQNTGVVWDLDPLPDGRPLAPPWKIEFTPGGDAVGEALADFDITEEIALFRNMHRVWRKGVSLLKQAIADARYPRAAEQELSAAEALNLIFESCVNILDFYSLRRMLFESGGGSRALFRMTGLLRREADLSGEMAELCRKDSRLGFHSEAMCHRFYPAALEWRKNRLLDVLTSVLPPFAEALEKGANAWTYFFDKRKIQPFSAFERWQQRGRLKFRISRDGNGIEIRIDLEGFENLFFYLSDGCAAAYPQWIRCGIAPSGEIEKKEDNSYPVTGKHNALFEKSVLSRHGDVCVLKIPADVIPGGKYFRLNFYGVGASGAFPAFGNFFPYRLYMSAMTPESCAFISTGNIAFSPGKIKEI